ncbi:MAG: hypothetical protein V5A79_04015 [Candidatus Bipolaricaulota bacterium]
MSAGTTRSGGVLDFLAGRQGSLLGAGREELMVFFPFPRLTLFDDLVV